MIGRTNQILFIMGFYFHMIQYRMGMAFGKDGVNHYAEVHTSFWNSIIHTLFMPVTIMGFYLFVPAVFKLQPSDARNLRINVMMFYLGLYVRISIFQTLLFCLLYYFPYVYSDKIYTYIGVHNRIVIISLGLILSLTALLIQEIIGHYIGGDDPSRTESIPNAILYAMYYSVAHFFI